jgi:hypothetical protein
VEPGRGNAGYGIALPIENHVASENACVGPEAPLPEAVAEHHHRVTARPPIVFGKDGTAEHHLDAQDGEVVAAHHLAPDALWLSHAPQTGGNEREVRRDATLEDVRGLLLIVQVVWMGEGAAFGEHHHPPWILDGQHTPEQPVGDAEDRGIGRDAQRD